MISFAALLVFFLFIVAKPAFGITIGVPDELLTGLPLAELHTFGKGVLTLFAGYTGVEPNIVEEPLDQLMQQLIQGDIDAVLSRPRTGITESDAYFEGSPLATVSTTLPAHGGFICLPTTSENLRIAKSLQLGLSATSACTASMDVELTLVPVYAKTPQGILFQNKFEEFLVRNYDAVSLVAKSVGFTPLKPTLANLFWSSPWSWLLLFLSMLLLFILGVLLSKLRKENRHYKDENRLQLEKLSNAQSRLLDLQNQIRKLIDDNTLLTEQKEKWAQAQKGLEIYISAFKELLKQLEVLGNIGKADSLSAEFIDQMCNRMKTSFSAKEVALYLYNPKEYKYILVGGHVEGIEPVLAMTDPMVYVSSQPGNVVEKNVAGEKVFIGTLGSFETENGFVIVKDPAIPNPNQLLSALCNTLYLVIALHRSNSRVSNMEQALSQLEKLEGARTREDFIATLNRAGFSIIEDFSDTNVGNFKGRLMRLDSAKIALVLPENWPNELDFILLHLVEEALSNTAE